MTDNPYQSPASPSAATRTESSLRRQAQRSFRAAVLVLLVPALYNYWAFDAIASARLPADLATYFRTINILALLVGCGLVWLGGVPILEAIARVLRLLLARGTDLTAWEEILYRALNWGVYLAIPGAVLWMIWVIGFYHLKIDFQVISWAVGVPAHLLAACVYLPLIFAWYRLAASQPRA